MKNRFSVVEVNGKFTIYKDGNPINLPSCGKNQKVTIFDKKDDAIKYKSILESLLQHERV